MQTIERRFYVPRWYDIRRVENMSSGNVLTAKLIDHAREMPQRKTLYSKDEHTSFPEPIEEALTVVHEQFRTDIPFNTAVMKRYKPGDSSDAFHWHMDPDEYSDEYVLGKKRIVLWSLTGYAELSVLDGNAPLAPFPCIPDSALLLPAHMKHKVTPPDPEKGERILLFFGQRN